MGKKRTVGVAVVMLAFGGCSDGGQQIDKIGVYDLASQRLSGAESVVAKDGNGFFSLDVVVTVDTDGDVIDAKVNGRNIYKLDPAPGLAAARRWTFRPQTFDGHSVQAVGTISIRYEAPEVPPDTLVPFPQAAPEDVEITLERTACYGSCPDYRVSIRGDGLVRFTTRQGRFSNTAADTHRMFNGDNVLWPGPHESHVDPKAVAALIGKFREAHFLGLKSEYIASVTDGPTYALTLRMGTTVKRVTDYLGRSVGMPASVTALESAVDELAGSSRWTKGNTETVRLLKARGFDFASHAAAALVQGAIQLSYWPQGEGSAAELIQAMMAQGLDLSIAVETGGSGTKQPIGVLIARFAVDAGDESLFKQVADRGYLARMGKNVLDAAFTGEMGCSSAIAKALVAAGANPKAQKSGNALHAVGRLHHACAELGADKQVEMARTLVALGVPLEVKDDLGWTPLMGCDAPGVAKVLLGAGANVNAKAKDGTTPLLSIDDDRVAILLLRAGADPEAKSAGGTVRDQARKSRWPATLAWLDAHGIR